MRKSRAPSYCLGSLMIPPTGDSSKVIRTAENILQMLTTDDSTENLRFNSFSVPDIERASNDLDVHNSDSNSESQYISSGSHSGQKFFTIMYAKPSNKKHKTWEGDGLLCVTDKLCIAKNELGKTIGSSPRLKSSKIEIGARLYFGDKEIEIAEEISAQDAYSLSSWDINANDAASNKSATHTATPQQSHLLSSSNQVDNESDTDETIFAIMYAKPSTRKHKVWEGDGTLHVSKKFATAKDEKGKVIGTCASSCISLEEGSRMLIGSKEVELLEKITADEYLKRKAEDEDTSSTLPPTKKFKPLHINKTFSSPRIGAVLKNSTYHLDADAFTLPNPSDDHQCMFRGGAPLTPVTIEPFIARHLRPHQRHGIIFLYECILGFRDCKISGAILADEMGLGKTLQCIALIWTLLRQGPYGKPAIRNALIVTPSSLTGNWAAEFKKWLGNTRMSPYVIDAKHKPCDRSQLQPVAIVSYEMLLRHGENIGGPFDLLICDEAHRLKNSDTKVSQALNDLGIEKRILLTGTPMQNDLQEFYALVDFCNPGCLGRSSDFRRKYEEPILAARQPEATDEVRETGDDCVESLNQVTRAFILRRTQSVLDSYLPGKEEVVVFCRPPQVQQSVYNSVLQTLDLSAQGWDGACHFAVISGLRKVANHPALLAKNDPDNIDTVKGQGYNMDDANIEDSGKLKVVVGLLAELWNSSPRERIVLVSAFTQTLDLLEEVCQMHSYPVLRLDGSTRTIHRTDIVARFNQDASQFVFLLSAKAGGVGLNLIGASRLVLYDSDWNPATDLQAMGRIWRDGQKRQVYIYRLLTTGTIEEKIFQRQLSKKTLSGGIVDSVSSNSVLLSREDLKEIFIECDDVDDCWTHASLGCECNGSGLAPVVRAVAEKENWPCQIQKPGAASTQSSSLRIEELMGWAHHASPFSHDTLNNLKLTQCQGVISYMFSTNC